MVELCAERRVTAWRRVILFSAVAAAIGFAAAGGATYAVVSGQQKAYGTARCAKVRCIPSLPAESVMDALRRKGHDCNGQSGRSWACELRIGETWYTTTAGIVDGLIGDITGTIVYPQDSPITPTRSAYLVWLATLPYGNDPVITADITAWITKHMRTGEDANATIGGYVYAISADPSRGLTLTVRAKWE
jgi:hypothetical protein